MANKRPKPEEIVSKLRQVEVLMGQGMSRLDAIRQIGVVEQTYYRWRKKYGGMGVDQLKERCKGIRLPNAIERQHKQARVTVFAQIQFSLFKHTCGL
nr:transposase [Ruegeria sp. HKCCE4150]